MWTESTIAVRFLQQQRTHTVLILVGVSVGVAVIVFITALITSLQENIIERTLGTQAHIRVEPPVQVNQVAAVPPGTLQLVHEDMRPQSLRSINSWAQVETVLATLPEVRAISPVVSGPAFARRGEATRSVALMGIDPVRYDQVVPLRRSLTAGQLSVGSGDAMVGTQLATDLGLRVGSKLRLEASDGRTAIMNVAGVFELGVRELDARYVYVDLKQAQALLDLPGGVTNIDVALHDVFAAEKTARRMVRLTGLKAESWMQTNGQLLNALQSQSMSTRMISFFVAVSVIFGIASVLAISVVQRTREIGILRAVGTRRHQLVVIFLIQGGLVGFIGAVAGVALGWALLWIFNHFGPGLFLVSLPSALCPLAIAGATLSGILAAAVPASRAARLDPVVAIRYV